MDFDKVLDEMMDTYSLDAVLLAVQRSCVKKADRIRAAEVERSSGFDTSKAWQECAKAVGEARTAVSYLDLEMP